MSWATGKTRAAIMAMFRSDTQGCLRDGAARSRIAVTDPGGGHMKHKLLGAPRQWWQNNPELGLATGWAVICGGLWLAVRVLGVA